MHTSAFINIFHKLREVINVHFCFISKGQFAAALLCLVNVAAIGGSNKRHPLNCLKDPISGEMKKFGNYLLLVDMLLRSSPE